MFRGAFSSSENAALGATRTSGHSRSDQENEGHWDLRLCAQLLEHGSILSNVAFKSSALSSESLGVDTSREMALMATVTSELGESAALWRSEASLSALLWRWSPEFVNARAAHDSLSILEGGWHAWSRLDNEVVTDDIGEYGRVNQKHAQQQNKLLHLKI